MNNSEGSSKKGNVAEILIILGIFILVGVLSIIYLINSSDENDLQEEKVIKEDVLCDSDKSKLTIRRDYWPDEVALDDIVTVVADVYGKIDGCNMVIVWKYQEIGSDNWVDINPETDSNYRVSDDYLTLSIVANEKTMSRNYYAVLYYK